MSSIKTSKAHMSLAQNTGRMNGGEHKEGMIKYVDLMPKRGDYGPGKACKPHNGSTHKPK